MRPAAAQPWCLTHSLRGARPEVGWTLRAAAGLGPGAAARAPAAPPLAADWLPTGLWLTLCDGAWRGGGGEVAARQAVMQVARVAFAAGAHQPPTSTALSDQLSQAGAQLAQSAVPPPVVRPVSGALVALSDGVAHLAWRGDVQAALVRRERVFALTRPHCKRPVHGAISLFTWLGGPDPQGPCTSTWRLKAGDRLVLASRRVWRAHEHTHLPALLTRPEPEHALAPLLTPDPDDPPGGRTALVIYIDPLDA